MNKNTAAADGLTGHLHPAAGDLLGKIRASGFPGWSAMSLDDARRLILQIKVFAGEPEAVARVEHLRIPRGESGEIQAGLYVPHSTVPIPVLVYMQGGGWSMGDYTGVDAIARALANRSGCAVLSINYRLAPENKYPSALEDVCGAIRWVRANGRERGLNVERIGIGGDSSGANLAAAASLLCRDNGEPQLSFQLLVYPALDHNYETESYRNFRDGSSSALSREDVIWFHQHYVNRPEELDLPYVSPLRAASLAGMPPTYLVLAELDPLRDDGVAYASRLQDAGVATEVTIYPGMFHGFWRMGGVLAQAQQAIYDAALRIRRALT
jgi:acetyl esterase